jgi:hypothetical protein
MLTARCTLARAQVHELDGALRLGGGRVGTTSRFRLVYVGRSMSKERLQDDVDISVLQEAVAGLNNNRGGHLRRRIHTVKQSLDFLPYMWSTDRQALKARTGTTTNGIEDQEALKAIAVISQRLRMQRSTISLPTAATNANRCRPACSMWMEMRSLISIGSSSYQESLCRARAKQAWGGVDGPSKRAELSALVAGVCFYRRGRNLR